jgi:D-alanyl-D-alanine dipeptidase
MRAPLPVLILVLWGWAAAAQTAGTPPAEPGKTFRAPELVELVRLDSTLRLDIHYARYDNFMGRPMYPEARAFLQRPAAEALVRVHRALGARGLGLTIFDAYRPWRVTRQFWDATPPAKRKYVADPRKGSIHNRGCAVDLTLHDRRTGAELPMPSPYDDFTFRASPRYGGGTPGERANRDLLRRAMEAESFTVNSGEWWHFDYRDWRSYPILDLAFSDLAKAGS